MNYGKRGTKRKQKNLNSSSSKISKKAGVSFIKAVCFILVALVVIGACASIGIIKGIISNKSYFLNSKSKFCPDI